jgi:hypothetical protein
VDLGDELMRVFASTVPGAPDELAHACGREFQEALALSDIVTGRANDGEGVVHSCHAARASIARRCRRRVHPTLSARRCEHQTQLGDPHTDGLIEIRDGMRVKARIASGMQQIADRPARRVHDDLPICH